MFFVRPVLSAVAIFLLIVGALAAVYYVYVFFYFIRVTNQSGQTLMDVQLLVPGNPREIGTMPPGDSRWFFVEPKADGGAALSFAAGGQRHREVDNGYMRGSDGDGIMITVQPSLRVTFRYKSFIP